MEVTRPVVGNELHLDVSKIKVSIARCRGLPLLRKQSVRRKAEATRCTQVAREKTVELVKRFQSQLMSSVLSSTALTATHTIVLWQTC